MANDERVLSGISGLDTMMHGGLPKGLNVVIAGGPGTGKTTACVQYLLQGAMKENEPGMLVTLHVEAASVIRFYKKFGWDLKKLIDENKLILKEIDVMHIQDYFSMLSKELLAEIREKKVKRFCFDSLTAMSNFYKDTYALNNSVYKLVSTLKQSDCTSLFTVESENAHMEAINVGGSQSVMDGLIALYNMRILNTRQRAIEIVKLRGTDHDKDLRPFAISTKGVEVYPQQVVFSGRE